MPRPPSRKSDPWSRGDVERVVAGREEDEGLTSLTRSMAEELVLSTRHPEWDDHPGLLPLAYAATLEEMARALQERAEKAVGIARGLGATWEEVAAATGYSNGVSAGRRYSREQRELAAKAQRRRRREQKAATSSPAGSSAPYEPVSAARQAGRAR